MPSATAPTPPFHRAHPPVHRTHRARRDGAARPRLRPVGQGALPASHPDGPRHVRGRRLRAHLRAAAIGAVDTRRVCAHAAGGARERPYHALHQPAQPNLQ
eukprot:1033198-Prymnesium_polylepis.1